MSSPYPENKIQTADPGILLIFSPQPFACLPLSFIYLLPISPHQCKEGILHTHTHTHFAYPFLYHYFFITISTMWNVRALDIEVMSWICCSSILSWAVTSRCTLGGGIRSNHYTALMTIHWWTALCSLRVYHFVWSAYNAILWATIEKFTAVDLLPSVPIIVLPSPCGYFQTINQNKNKGNL